MSTPENTAAVLGTSWPEVFRALTVGEDLSDDVAAWAMGEMMAGDATEGQVGGFLLALAAKGVTVPELRGLTDEYKKRLADGESLDDLMPEAFATVREAVQALVHAGMLERRQGSGTYVLSACATSTLGDYFSAARDTDLLELREALEVTGADRDQALVSFVGEASPEDLAALRRALADLA